MTAAAKLNRDTQLGVDEAVRIATDVADALHYAHELNRRVLSLSCCGYHHTE
jgi:hypothetical protein